MWWKVFTDCTAFLFCPRTNTFSEQYHVLCIAAFPQVNTNYQTGQAEVNRNFFQSRGELFLELHNTFPSCHWFSTCALPPMKYSQHVTILKPQLSIRKCSKCVRLKSESISVCGVINLEFHFYKSICVKWQLSRLEHIYMFQKCIHRRFFLL